MLGGLLLTGAGVGLTLPTLMATAAASLPPTSFATGSAVVNMLRQVGLAIGVAVLIAVLGSPELAGGDAGRLSARMDRHGRDRPGRRPRRPAPARHAAPAGARGPGNCHEQWIALPA